MLGAAPSPAPSCSLGILGPAVAMLLVLSGCGPRTTERLKDEALQDLQAGRFAEAAATVDRIYDSAPGDWNEKHGLLWMMERGTIARLGGEHDAAWRLLGDASDLAKAKRGRDFVRQTGSWLANDTVTAYAGAPYEHAWIEISRILMALERAQVAAGWFQASTAPVLPSAAALPRPGPPPPTAMVDEQAAAAAWQDAINIARGLTNDVLQWTEDIAGSERYRDDPFARVLAAVSVLALPRPMAVDRQYAVVQSEAALAAYAAERRSLARGPQGYSVDAGLELPRAIHARALAAFDRDRLAPVLRSWGLTEELAQGRGILPPADHGTVVLLHEDGWAARRHVLDIRVVAGHARYTVQPGPGLEVAHRRIGGFAFWLEGPDVSVADSLFALPIPAGLGQILAPGGLAMLGFAVPVHAPDRPVAGSPPAVTVVGPTGTPLQVGSSRIADVDAQARVTLKDHQAGIIAKTLTRAVSKNLAAAIAARQARKEREGIGLLVGLIGSTLATVTEIADTRCWTTLAGVVDGCLIDLPPGRHALALTLSSGQRVPLGTVQVEPGRYIVVSTRSLPPPPLVPR